MLRGVILFSQFSRHFNTVVMDASKEAVLGAAKDFLSFVNKSPSPFHATEQCRQRLLTAGFKEIKETDSWNIKPNDKVKPVSRRVKQGYIQVGVECYGGGSWYTWFDRDLKISGQVMIKEGDKICHRLVDVNRPVLCVPNLAIHLQRDMATKFEFNKETHLTPILATTVREQLEMGNVSGQDVDHTKDQTLGGVFEEFIFSPRLDNLHNTYCALEGVVIKFNANQRYATTSLTTTIFREVARRARVPLQDFVVRNDSPCGSTIGPIMSAKLGIPTLDVGSPQLSMHSIREMCSTVSIHQTRELYKTFFEVYPNVFQSVVY
ncbi:hypothetical protein LSH36_243g00050 [Paralvinella palmiformis]|uniref:Aspartyl aminopeptidase n=1 Tax=Paralvinella palmiformis TaxID=53620 RepID=A0AAD9N522_9ANNE|nr:hypothetical protein LSH36_243g00050 [Paralvinella palmiformis]